VENRVLMTEKDYSQSQLDEAGNFLNQNYIGCSFSQIRREIARRAAPAARDMSALMAAALAAWRRGCGEEGRRLCDQRRHKLLSVHDLSPT